MGSHAEEPLVVRALNGTLKHTPLPKPETLEKSMEEFCARPQCAKSTEYVIDTDTDDDEGTDERRFTSKQPQKE